MLMEKIINLLQSIKKCLRGKTGGYLFEATIVMPLFFSAITVLVSIIPMISVCEETVYIMSDEIRHSCLKQNFVGYDLGIESSFYNRVDSTEKLIERFEVEKHYQGISKFGMKNVNVTKFECDVSLAQPFGFNNRIFFDGKIGSRAFNGKKNYDIPTSLEEFLRSEDSNKVLIFPKEGARYHKHGCRYTSPYCKQTYLTSKIRNKYSPCKTCDSKNMSDGESVFYFTKNGSAYHRGSCKTIKKYYIEVEKHDAEKKGYTPCSSCLGSL